MKLDKRSSIPLYAQLKDLLSERITNGEYQPGDKIPTELALCAELDLSRPTVRQAIAELVAEGMLYIVKGRGTFVTETPEYIMLPNYDGFSFSFLSQNENKYRRLLDYRQITRLPAEIKSCFGKKADYINKGVYLIEWVEEKEDIPYAYCNSYVPVEFFPNLLEQIRRQQSLVDILANRYPLVPSKAEAMMHLRPALAEEARYLDIAKAYPVFAHQAKIFNRTGQVVEVLTAILPSATTAFTLNTLRK